MRFITLTSRWGKKIVNLDHITSIDKSLNGRYTNIECGFWESFWALETVEEIAEIIEKSK